MTDTAPGPDGSRGVGPGGLDRAEGRPARRILVGLLAIGVGLRTVLALGGGQGFFPDEARYLRSVRWVDLLVAGRWGPAADLLVAAPDHTGWVVVGSIPALAQGVLRRLAGLSSGDTPSLPALILCIASVACIGLVYALARRLGAGTWEALAASVLMSCASTFLYFSRHLLPYDASMGLCLAALWCGLGTPLRPAGSLACGLLGGAAFLTYNGHWGSVVVVLALHALCGARSTGEALRRGFRAAAAALALPAGFVLLGAARGGGYLEGMTRFSGTVTQCDVAEGWSAAVEYLWHAEHGLLLVWAAGAVALLGRGLEAGARRRGQLWLLGALTVYLLLVVSSSGFGRFCVYGRLARQVVPFLCLATASAATRLERIGRAGGPLACGAVVLIAAFNLVEPFRQRFPRDFAREAARDHPSFRREATILGPESGGIVGPARYVLLNARYLWPVRGVQAAPPGEVVLQAPHPLEFLPYQYESFTADERRILRATDISMRLIDTRPRGAGVEPLASGPGGRAGRE